jgi:arginyl-tRNA synthetase
MKENEILRNRVLQILNLAVAELIRIKEISIRFEELNPKIEYSRNEKFGDYSTAFLLEYKERLGNPLENSNLFISFLKNPLFSEITFSQPGFINFRISRETLVEYLNSFLFNNEIQYPKVEKKEKVIFEFVSANPTGPLNIVSARAAAMGASITNLLEKIGHTVEREFYVNDYGNQVLLLGASCVVRLRELLGVPATFQEEGDNSELITLLKKNILPYEGYRGEYVTQFVKYIYGTELKEKIDSFLKKERYLELANSFSILATDFNLSTQKKDLENFGVEFQTFYSERSLHESGQVLESLEHLRSAGKIIKEGEKEVFLSTHYGDDKDRVVLREDKRPTYLLADIAYHKTKIDRGFTKIINIWGPDHHGYISRLAGAMQALGYPKESFRILIAQQVNLLSKGEKLKMSKRMGQFQTMDDLMEFLGKDSRDIARYFFITRALETPLDFDLDLAKEESDKNPVFYLQYAYARIQSIFKEVGKESSRENFLNLNPTEERDRLLFWIARFPEEIMDAAKNMEPHRLANYLQNLAKAFSKFYIAKGNKLKDCETIERRGLTFLCEGTSNCLREGLQILGVSTPLRMDKEIK